MNTQAQSQLAPFRFTGPCHQCGRQTYGDGAAVQEPYTDPVLTYLTFWVCDDCRRQHAKLEATT